MPIDPSAFRTALSQFASGVTIVTALDADGRDVGMTVTAFSSLSLDPPLVLLCIDRAASAAPALDACERFVVNILASDQAALARRFAEREVERFEGVALRRGLYNVALLDGALAHLECHTHERTPGGDHTILMGAVDAAHVGNGAPLLYVRNRYGRFET
jgi:flavin reductase (DIM6/NTAB) family NADH-FMN oxidoreductase RutF